MERHPRRVLSEYKLFLKGALSLKFRRVSPLVVVVDIGCSAKEGEASGSDPPLVKG